MIKIDCDCQTLFDFVWVKSHTISHYKQPATSRISVQVQNIWKNILYDRYVRFYFRNICAHCKKFSCRLFFTFYPSPTLEYKCAINIINFFSYILLLYRRNNELFHYWNICLSIKYSKKEYFLHFLFLWGKLTEYFTDGISFKKYSKTGVFLTVLAKEVRIRIVYW